MSSLTIEFDIPSPPSTNGYIIKYRPKGSTLPYNTVHATTSPVVITDIEKKDYEGIIQSDCGDGTFGSSTPFEAVLPPMTSITGSFTIQCINTANNSKQGDTVFNFTFPTPPNRDVRIAFAYCQAGGGGFVPFCTGVDLIPTLPNGYIGNSECQSGFIFTIPAGSYSYTTPIFNCISDNRTPAACLGTKAFTYVYMKVQNFPNLILNFASQGLTFQQLT